MKKSFTQWFIANWRETGGLITQRTSAHLLNMADQSVADAGERGRLKIYEFEKTKYYSYNEVMEFKAERKSKKK